jgi:hypothetical protein
MKAEPAAVLEQLKRRQLDPHSATAREMVEEVVERVLRNLTPHEESPESSDFSLTERDASAA